MWFDQDEEDGKDDWEQVKNNRVLIAKGKTGDKGSITCDWEHYLEHYLEHKYDVDSDLSSRSNRTSL